MTNLPVYSSFFSTIYNEPSPVGNIGRGVHYSILRCAEWFNVSINPLTNAQVHDFAVIFDEDHDTRVIQAIEQIYIAGLLSPVQFIGERKGGLTIIVAAKYYFSSSEAEISRYKKKISKIADSFGSDCWSADVGFFDRSEYEHQCDTKGIIAASEYRSLLYLKNIDSIWNLGTRDYSKSDSLIMDIDS